MNAYATIVLKAVAQCGSRNPALVWQEVANLHFLNSPTSVDKGCPKDAYLGLCEAGYVKGVPPGRYTRSKKNKQYALDAFNLIKNNPSLADNPIELWKLIDNSPETHNGQMYVVCALFHAGLLNV